MEIGLGQSHGESLSGSESVSALGTSSFSKRR